MQTVLTTNADQAARACSFVRRRHCLSSISFVRALDPQYRPRPAVVIDAEGV
jgi:hypothetical protein